MKAFRFRLARVLDWQRTCLSIEEQKLERLIAERVRLETEREQARQERIDSGRQVSRRSDLYGSDLVSLNAYSLRLEAHARSLALSIEDSGRRIASQRAAVTEARRRVRLLEKLRERRLTEWNADLTHEVDTLASEFTISQFNRS